MTTDPTPDDVLMHPAHEGDLVVCVSKSNDREYYWLATVANATPEGLITHVVKANGETIDITHTHIERINVVTAAGTDTATAIAHEQHRINSGNQWHDLDEVRLYLRALALHQ